MPYFAKRGIETYALSLRAHGNSDPIGDAICTMADTLEDISSFISGLDRPPVLIGHSIGGIIAQRWVIECQYLNCFG